MGRKKKGLGKALAKGGGIFAKRAGRFFRKARLRDKLGRFKRDPRRPKSKVPQWTDSDRRREWRRLVDDPNSPLTPAQRKQIIERGYRGPRRRNPITKEWETMELSHEPIPRAQGGKDVVPRWPDDHAAVDPNRHLKGNRVPNTNEFPE